VSSTRLADERGAPVDGRHEAWHDVRQACEDARDKVLELLAAVLEVRVGCVGALLCGGEDVLTLFIAERYVDVACANSPELEDWRPSCEAYRCSPATNCAASP
jgi:hypothetical protein